MDGDTVQGQQTQTTTQTPPVVAPVATPTPPVVDPVAELRKQVESLTKSVTAFQSEKDKATARAIKAERDTATARSEMEATKRRLDGITTGLGKIDDPDVVRAVRETTQEQELTYYRNLAQQQTQRQTAAEQAQEFEAKFKESMTEGLKEFDIDASNPEIDWAADAPDAFTRQRRVMASAGKIAKKARDAMKAEETVAKANADKETHNPDVGGGTGSTRTFTQEEITDRAFWKANKAEILKARAEGRIK